MKKKKFLRTLLQVCGFSIIPLIGISFVPNIHNATSNQSNGNQNQRISLQDEKMLVNHADLQTTQTLGTLRRWQNNNFTGIQLADKGFAVLTGNTDSGYSVSRTNSFGGVQWTYNPQTYEANSNLTAGNDSRTTYDVSMISQKAVVEIQQDSQDPTTYYATLIPKIALDNPTSYWSSATYAQLQNNPALQASIVQIKENLNSSTNLFDITAFANINPKVMVDNYPSTWKVANGPNFFSSADHPTWFSQDASSNQRMSMYGEAYLANIGNMYVANGYVLLFGGNGSEFTNPDALSIGIFRINFADPKNIEVTGIPYAYVLAGLANTAFIGRYRSGLPVGQDTTFSYVPRMAVGGVSAYPGVTPAQSPIVFLAGSLTVGQDANAWNYAKLHNGRSTVIGLSADSNSATTLATNVTITTTQDLKGFGSYGDKNYVSTGSGSGNSASYTTRWSNVNTSMQTNFLPTSAQGSMPTQKNSIDPLTLAGFKLNLPQILSLQTSTISDVSSSTPNLSYLYIVDSTYFDFGINSGFVTGYYTGTRNEAAVASWVSGGNGFYGRPQQAWDGGLGMFTSLFGYSPKAVANLEPYVKRSDSNTGNNLGFVMQVGAFIYFFNLTGYDGYTQLPDANFSPVMNLSTTAAPTDPTTSTISASNANAASQYYTYSLMPPSAYAYDVALGSNPAYFDNNTNQLANADSAKLATVRPWKDFAGLAVANTSLPGITSTWIANNNRSVMYVNTSFDSTSFTDNNQQVLPTTVQRMNWQNYYNSSDSNVGGSFIINGASTKTTQISSLNNINTNNISGIINVPNGTMLYLQNNGLGVSYYNYLQPSNIVPVVSFTDGINDEKNYLGYGNFITNPSENLTTKNIKVLYETVGGQNILKNDYFNEIFEYHPPTLSISSQITNLNPRIILTNVNVVTQSATFTAQVINPYTNYYVTIPGSQGEISQNANVTYQNFFDKQPGYLLAVAIAVPIVVVALIIGLGTGIGIPLSKNKKALKKGFDVSNKKVDTLTTAVGSVFKKIIKETKIATLKQPKMLNDAKVVVKPPTPVKPPKPKAPVKNMNGNVKLNSNIPAPTKPINDLKKG